MTCESCKYFCFKNGVPYCCYFCKYTELVCELQLCQWIIGEEGNNK